MNQPKTIRRRGLATSSTKKLQRSDCTLTKEIAVALAHRIEQQGKIFNRGEWTKKIPLRLTLTNGEVVNIKVQVYNRWISKNTIPKGMEVPLRVVCDQARERFRDIKFEKQRAKMVRQAERCLHYLLKMEPTTRAVNTRRKYKVNKEGKKILVEFNEDIQEQQNDPRMVAIKKSVAEFIPSKLSDAYNPVQKSERKELHVSLKDLREQAEEEKKSKVKDGNDDVVDVR